MRWTHPPHAVDRRIRGCTPAPGAWTTLPDGSRLGLGPVTRRPDVTDLAPGELRAGKRDVLVGTGGHAVRLGDVTPQGKRPMAAADWARGARLEGTVVLGGARMSADDRRDADRPAARAAACAGPDAALVGGAVPAAQGQRRRPDRRLRRAACRGGHGLLREPRPAAAAARAPDRRPRRRVRHRAGLRDAAPPGSLRRRSSRWPPPGRPRRSTRRSSTSSGSARTSCSACGCRRTPRSPRRSAWRASSSAPGPPSSSTRSCARSAGSRSRSGRSGSPRATDELGALAAVQSHPLWVVRALREALVGHGRSADEIEELLVADNVAPHVTVVARPGLADADEVLADAPVPRAARSRRPPWSSPAATRRRCRACATGGPASRTRAASWSRSR